MGEKGKDEAWKCTLCNKVCRGRNGTKAARHYDRSVQGADIKACTCSLPQPLRYQLNLFMSKKRLSKELLNRRRSLQKQSYDEDNEASAERL